MFVQTAMCAQNKARSYRHEAELQTFKGAWGTMRKGRSRDKAEPRPPSALCTLLGGGSGPPKPLYTLLGGGLETPQAFVPPARGGGPLPP